MYLEGVGQDDAGEGLVVAGVGVFAGQGVVGGFDVDRGDVVGQQRDLVGVQLFRILAHEITGGDKPGLQKSGDKGAGAGESVEDVHTFVGECFAEVGAAGVIGGFEDEVDHFDRGVDDPEGIGLLLERGLEELLVQIGNQVLFTLSGDDLGRT